jgi:hypothetical protein
MGRKMQRIDESLKNQLDKLEIGDLISVSWCDASIGKSLSVGSEANIDVPVQSWGIYLGVLGAKAKHIILGQNCFCYADGLYDLDYTAIPLSWSTDVSVISQKFIPREECTRLVNSFVHGGHRMLNRPRIFQRVQKRLSVDGRPD